MGGGGSEAGACRAVGDGESPEGGCRLPPPWTESAAATFEDVNKPSIIEK